MKMNTGLTEKELSSVSGGGVDPKTGEGRARRDNVLSQIRTELRRVDSSTSPAQSPEHERVRTATNLAMECRMFPGMGNDPSSKAFDLHYALGFFTADPALRALRNELYALLFG